MAPPLKPRLDMLVLCVHLPHDPVDRIPELKMVKGLQEVRHGQRIHRARHQIAVRVPGDDHDRTKAVLSTHVHRRAVREVVIRDYEVELEKRTQPSRSIDRRGAAHMRPRPL